MPPTLRTILRTTTTTFRPSPTPQANISRPYSHLRRTPSPPPPYTARNHSLLASSTHWTRFTTPYTYTSVRTFTRSHPSFASSSKPSSTTPSTSPGAARAIEAAIDEITEMYGTARDEFEIAAEETEKNTTYAEDDRAAAREELDTLLTYYKGVVEGEDKAVAEEVKRRVGQRIRELEQAVLAMEESVTHGD
jgi:hypothetical protein